MTKYIFDDITFTKVNKDIKREVFVVFLHKQNHDNFFIGFKFIRKRPYY